MIEGMNSNTTLAIAGTASDTSGIASVMVNGEPANDTLDWSTNVTSLDALMISLLTKRSEPSNNCSQ
ncbi:MAG: hypothetical protein DNFNHJIP_00056 [Candidatus Argoarchaeum ethanivorans]|uniref:Uncharacterized protein n=1 Tax=Candidatus Argoarchaeum ethanivorans TaxID=2608793 RepID=A0A811ZZI2_9EURY|nr:MAG: hypothetical protein DNFNHJIP_00056 [Candidatus Argoarchaeum ethanivorans]